jgi:hypothetical protein
MRRLFVPTARLKASNYGRGLQKQVGLLGGLDSDDPGQANGLQRLAQGVIIQAARDARDGNREAAAWLADPETADTWLFIAGLDRREVMRWVAAGCKRGLRKRKRISGKQ